MTARSLRLDGAGRLRPEDRPGGPQLSRLLDLLNAEGEEARVIGGAVRNALLGRPVADVDVATTAEPDLVMRRAKAARLRALPTGLAHGTVTVLVEGLPIEVTTLRQDIETDGRHAVVRFTRDFAQDAARRDFTINALSMTADGVVHDTTGGVEDLRAGRVRFIGDADQRIREDYLRVLRFFRFHAGYGLGPLDPEGLEASTRHRDALTRLSRERVRAEMLKLLAAAGAGPVVATMAQAGIASLVLAGPVEPGRLDRVVEVETGFGLAPDPLLRLAALALRGEDDAERLRDALRLSNDEARRLAAAVAARRALDPAHPPERNDLLALLFAHGARGALDGVLLAAADAEGAADWRPAVAAVGSEVIPRLPIGGAEVMARGVAGGRRVGAVLKAFQAAWIRAGFPADPIRLGALLDEAIAAENRTP